MWFHKNALTTQLVNLPLYRREKKTASLCEYFCGSIKLRLRFFIFYFQQHALWFSNIGFIWPKW